jgi:hypothetical protein
MTCCVQWTHTQGTNLPLPSPVSALSAFPERAAAAGFTALVGLLGCFALLAAGCLESPQVLANASAAAALLGAAAVARRLVLTSNLPGVTARMRQAECVQLVTIHSFS